MMTTLYIFTEERSAKNVFDIILPKILPQNVLFKVYPHQGKEDLEKSLPKTIPTISKMPGAKILIVRDQDSGDCRAIKENIRKIIEDKCHCDFSIRIVCKELEGWFLGDLVAIELAYTRFKSSQYKDNANMRDVDSIVNPSDYLCRIIPEYSRSKNLPKIEVSQKISPFLTIENNTSTSFQHTINAIRQLAEK